jgi:hypothetical protein
MLGQASIAPLATNRATIIIFCVRNSVMIFQMGGTLADLIQHVIVPSRENLIFYREIACIALIFTICVDLISISAVNIR